MSSLKQTIKVNPKKKNMKGSNKKIYFKGKNNKKKKYLITNVVTVDAIVNWTGALVF
jgi:hypothetical protein